MMNISSVEKIVILTGAGISAESGIKTFRDQNGLWENHDVLDVATPQGFERDPELVYRFYNQRRAQLFSKEVAPNPAHFALAKLEQEFRGEVILITQNVDDLHERAGHKNVLHMHGELLKMRCIKTGQVYPIKEDLHLSTVCSCCQSAGNLRPHIVWFGELPFHLNKIEDHLGEADLFLSVGTSGVVYPAAMFVEIAKNEPGCKAVEINLEQGAHAHAFDRSIYGKASEHVPLFVDEILMENYR